MDLNFQLALSLIYTVKVMKLDVTVDSKLSSSSIYISKGIIN